MDEEFDAEDIRALRQILTAWRGLNAIGSIAMVIKRMFWFIVLIFAIYLASTGHFGLLNSLIPGH